MHRTGSQDLKKQGKSVNGQEYPDQPTGSANEQPPSPVPVELTKAKTEIPQKPEDKTKNEQTETKELRREFQ
jgi:hypothetical protein